MLGEDMAKAQQQQRAKQGGVGKSRRRAAGAVSVLLCAHLSFSCCSPRNVMRLRLLSCSSGVSVSALAWK